MALITGQDFILMALRKIGQMRPGYICATEFLTEILNDWQLFFDELNAERNNIWSNPDYVYPVTGPGSQSGGNGYQIGPTSADWVGPRPVSIIRANLVFTSQGGSPVYIQLKPISQEEWAGLAIRQIPAVNVTSVFWYDPQFPNGVFNVFPPLSGNSIELFETGFLTAPATLNTSYSAPPGYADMVIWNLAARNYYSVTKQDYIRLIPYGIVASRAANSLNKVRAMNRPLPKLNNDAPRGDGPNGFYDSFVTYTGEPY